MPALASGPANLNSPDIIGYLSRGKAMWDNRNFEGCWDQMSRVLELNPTSEEECEARWYLALSSISLEDENALQLLEQWIADYPGSPKREEALMAVGDVYFNSGDYDDALSAYSKVNANAFTGSQASNLLYREAYCQLMQGNLDAAEKGFAELVNNPRLGQAAQFYCGYIAYSRKEYKKALAAFERVESGEAPANAAPYFMAQIYYVEGDNESALRYARKAIASGLSADSANESKRIAGESLYAMGDKAGASEYLWDYAANAKNPAPSAYYILGLNEWDRGDYKASGKLMQQAVGSDDAMGQSAWLYLGQAYLKEGNTDSALMAFENSFKMNYDRSVSETAFYNYAVAKSNGGKAPFESSAAVFEEFLERYPSSKYRSAVQRYIVTGYLNDEDYEAALKAIDRYPSSDSEMLAAKKRALFSLGVKEASTGNHEQAVRRFNSARSIGSGDAALTRQATLWEADSYRKLGRTAQAERDYRDFIADAPASDPNLGLAYYNLGYLLYESKNYGEASEAFTKAVNSGKLDARSAADARTRMADILYYGKKYSSAGAQYRSAAELSPSTADYALFRAAVMKGLGGNRHGEVSELDAMIQAFPSSAYVPEAMLEKASALSLLNRREEAEATYAEVLERYPATAQGRKATLLLAIDRRDCGDTAGAIEAYKKVITDYSSSEEARLAAEDLKQLMVSSGKGEEYVAFMNSVPGAPQIEFKELDSTTFRTAEQKYLEEGNVEPLQAYIGKYPGGLYEAEALYYLAEEASKRGNTEESVRYAKRLTETHPTSSVTEDALVILAEGQLREGKPDEALATFDMLEKSASTAANLLRARMGIMTTALRTDNNSRVIDTADKVLASANVPAARLEETRFMKALALARTGATAEAEQLWEKSAANTQDINGAKSAVYLAQSLLDRGDAVGAQKVADKLIDSNTPHSYWLARGFIVLSDSLRAQGKTFEADQYLTTLRKNYPGREADIFSMIEERLTKTEDK